LGEEKRFCTAWVKTGKAQCEQMFSAVHPTTDIAKILRHVRFVHARRNGETKRLGSAGRNLGLPVVDTEDDKTPH
jgi:hypothetical protein